MSTQIIGLPPVTEPNPPQSRSFLHEIAYKKVNGVALSCLECLAHFFATVFCCFYPSYDKFYNEEVVKKEAARVAAIVPPPTPPTFSSVENRLEGTAVITPVADPIPVNRTTVITEVAEERINPQNTEKTTAPSPRVPSVSIETTDGDEEPTPPSVTDPVIASAKVAAAPSAPSPLSIAPTSDDEEPTPPLSPQQKVMVPATLNNTAEATPKITKMAGKGQLVDYTGGLAGLDHIPSSYRSAPGARPVLRGNNESQYVTYNGHTLLLDPVYGTQHRRYRFLMEDTTIEVRRSSVSADHIIVTVPKCEEFDEEDSLTYDTSKLYWRVAPGWKQKPEDNGKTKEYVYLSTDIDPKKHTDRLTLVVEEEEGPTLPEPDQTSLTAAPLNSPPSPLPIQTPEGEDTPPSLIRDLLGSPAAPNEKVLLCRGGGSLRDLTTSRSISLNQPIGVKNPNLEYICRKHSDGRNYKILFLSDTESFTEFEIPKYREVTIRDESISIIKTQGITNYVHYEHLYEDTRTPGLRVFVAKELGSLLPRYLKEVTPPDIVEFATPHSSKAPVQTAQPELATPPVPKPIRTYFLRQMGFSPNVKSYVDDYTGGMVGLEVNEIAGYQDGRDPPQYMTLDKIKVLFPGKPSELRDNHFDLSVGWYVTVKKDPQNPTTIIIKESDYEGDFSHEYRVDTTKKYRAKLVNPDTLGGGRAELDNLNYGDLPLHAWCSEELVYVTDRTLQRTVPGYLTRFEPLLDCDEELLSDSSASDVEEEPATQTAVSAPREKIKDCRGGGVFRDLTASEGQAVFLNNALDIENSNNEYLSRRCSKDGRSYKIFFCSREGTFEKFEVKKNMEIRTHDAYKTALTISIHSSKGIQRFLLSGDLYKDTAETPARYVFVAMQTGASLPKHLEKVDWEKTPPPSFW